MSEIRNIEQHRVIELVEHMLGQKKREAQMPENYHGLLGS
jgi:hypothetical protein